MKKERCLGVSIQKPVSAHLSVMLPPQGGTISASVFWIGPAEGTDQKQVTCTPPWVESMAREVEPCVKGTVLSLFTNKLSGSHLLWLGNKDVRVNKASSAPVLA